MDIENHIDEEHRKELLRFLLVKTAAVRRGVKPAELLRVRHCYPLKDVAGFMERIPSTPVHNATCWRVYGNADESLRRMSAYRREEASANAALDRAKGVSEFIELIAQAFTDSFCVAAETIAGAAKDAGATLVGEVLKLDDTNEPDKTDGRVAAWVSAVKAAI